MSWRPESDRSWRPAALSPVMALCPPLSGRYGEDLEEQVEFLLSRIEPLVLRGRHDCEISFERVPLADISVRDPDREAMSEDGYPQLRRDLSVPGYDSVPIICGRQGDRIAVWDGHHRLRTYEQAGRGHVPALVATFVRGTGQVRLAPRR